MVVPDQVAQWKPVSFKASSEMCIRDRLIDPAPSGGHAESDLAALGVFGQPYLEEIYRGYNQVSPLASGWQERINLHQIHMLAVHANLFGGSYGSHTVDLARQYL